MQNQQAQAWGTNNVQTSQPSIVNHNHHNGSNAIPDKNQQQFQGWQNAGQTSGQNVGQKTGQNTGQNEVPNVNSKEYEQKWNAGSKF